MSHYTQLTREERYQISALKTAGHNQVEIAKVLGRHKSTVSRELARNCELRGYRPKQANAFAENARKRSPLIALLPSPGHELSNSYTNTGAQSKSATGYDTKKILKSVPSGSINTSLRTNK